MNIHVVQPSSISIDYPRILLVRTNDQESSRSISVNDAGLAFVGSSVDVSQKYPGRCRGIILTAGVDTIDVCAILLGLPFS